MDAKLRRILLIIVATAITLTAAILLFALSNGKNIGPADRLKYYQLYVDTFKAIVIGFGVALFGVLLPAILTEARSRFERLKESRIAYSNAKTGVDYLALRLAAMSLADAGAHIQTVHVHKHQAELYDELRIWLKLRYRDDPTRNDPEKWAEFLYDKIYAMRVILEENAQTWDSSPPDIRLALLLASVPSEKET